MNLGHYYTNDESLKSEIKKLTYNYELYDFCFLSDNGVFSKDKIDYGSRLLVETFLNESSNGFSKVLDVGCGYGFIGTVIGKVKNCEIDMIDVNKRAMHLSKRNLELNGVQGEVFESDCYSSVTKKYDVIITNPPIRMGKSVLEKILTCARGHLEIGGSLWFVMRKDHGAKSFEKLLKNYYELRIVEKSKGFYIFEAKNVDLS